MMRWMGAAGAVVLAAGVAGCGGGSGSDGTKTVTSTSTVTKTAAAASPSTKGDYASVVALRDALLSKAKVSCSDWVPMMIPDVAGATEQGLCDNSLTLVTFSDSELTEKAMAYRLAVKNADDVAHAADAADSDLSFVVGRGWGVQGQRIIVQLVHDAMGGELPTSASS